MLSGYVDDVRQGGTALRLGMRWKGEKWSWSKEDTEEDKRKRENGESRDKRMARVCAPLMNSINNNLEFTTEVAEDFANNRLPTLDFEMWTLPNGRFNHMYFQKPMKVKIVTMKNSAMSQQQKCSILSNEVVRRLSKINVSKIDRIEVIEVMNNFTQEMKNSGYERKEAMEIIKSGMIGWKRKLQRRSKEDQGFYRSAASTVCQRYKKKLLEKTNWYRKRKREEEAPFPGEREKGENGAGGKRRKREKLSEKGENRARELVIKCSQRPAAAVIFVPFTTHNALAKSMREAEEKLGELTGYKLKVVERAGTKLEDILHKSDPWQGMDCGRRSCLLCTTKSKTGKNTGQDCFKRSCVYEIWCMKCYEKEEKELEIKYPDEKE